MRIVASVLIALALIFGVSVAATPMASADNHEDVKVAAQKEAKEAKQKREEADKKAKEAEQKAKAAAEARKEADKARAEADKAKAEAAKANEKARAQALKAARKERLLKQEQKRHEAQMGEINSRRRRITELYERQIKNVDGAEAREKARHEKRVQQIEAQ